MPTWYKLPNHIYRTENYAQFHLTWMINLFKTSFSCSSRFSVLHSSWSEEFYSRLSILKNLSIWNVKLFNTCWTEMWEFYSLSWRYIPNLQSIWPLWKSFAKTKLIIIPFKDLCNTLLQPFTKYLRQTLVFMWNSARQEKFNFFFSVVLC